MKNLTPNELETLKLVLRGKPHKQIALELGVSIPTVRTRMFRARAKLGASGLSEALFTSLKLGLLTLDDIDSRTSEVQARFNSTVYLARQTVRACYEDVDAAWDNFETALLKTNYNPSVEMYQVVMKTEALSLSLNALSKIVEITKWESK